MTIPGGWFDTGEHATHAAYGDSCIVGRRSTGLIESDGYRIGGAKFESTLLQHPTVVEIAETREPDPAAARRMPADEFVVHTPPLFASHTFRREVLFVAELPRAAMGEIAKKRFGTRPVTSSFDS